MVRKRIAKPADPPPFAPTPNQDAQIEALVTFLDTGSPLREPIQATGPPESIQTSGYQGLPQGGYNMRSKEGRGGSQRLAYRIQNSEHDMKTFLRALDEEGEESFWKRIDSKKAPTLLSKFEQAEGFEKHHDQFRDSQVLNDLKGRIGALTGHISNDERSKLHAKLQSITEQMKATPLNTKVFLNHPDGSPNENAFEEEATVQKLLQEISDLQTNILLLANTVNKGKEPANDAQDPAKEAKEPVREKSDEVEWDTENAIPKTKPLRIRSGQSYESISMPPMDTQGPELTANTNHSSSRTRDAATDAMLAPKPNMKTELEVKTEGEQPAIQDFGTTGDENIVASDWAHLPTTKPVMYSDVSHSEKNIDLWVAFWNGDKSAWDPLHEYLIGFSKSTRDDLWEEQMRWLREGISDPALSDVWVPKPLGEATRTTARQIDKFDLPLRKKQFDKQNMKMAVDSEQLFKKLEVLQKPSQLWSNVELKRQLVQYNDLRRKDQIQKRWDRMHELGSSMIDLEVQRHEAEVALKRREEQLQKSAEKSPESKIQPQDTEDLLKQREELLEKRLKEQQETSKLVQKRQENLHERETRQRELAGLLNKLEKKLQQREDDMKNREVEWEKHQKQRQEIEGLLTLREEHLNTRENQRQEIDRLLQKLEEKLQERELQLAEREQNVHNREVEWEKHKEQQREMEALMEQRDEQLQKRDEQLQTREYQALQRDDQLLSRERLLQRREVNTGSSKLNDDQLAALQKTVDEVMEVRALKINLSKRIRAIEGREMDASFVEEWVDALRKILEKRRGAEHVEVNVELGASGSPITMTNWLAMLGIVEMSVKHGKVTWLNRHPKFWDFRDAVDYIEKDGEVSFEGGGVKRPQYKKSAIDASKDKEEIVAAFKQKAVVSRQWKEWGDDNTVAAASKEDDKPTSQGIFNTEKPPTSTLVDGCSGKWGCVCKTCRDRDEIWNVHKPSSNKNGTGKRCKCDWGTGCDRRRCCEGNEDETAKATLPYCAKRNVGEWEFTCGPCRVEAEKLAAPSSAKKPAWNWDTGDW
ncbi:hypothetical protein VF21_01321 [Pseudogymnoascus sp. 05NY08]|nr:hypothetical protein VF21_01321 [Pseudogymnoascus sp. 05NY08]